MHTPIFCILYVDDDENDVRLLEFAAQSADVSQCLRTVNSGQLALEYLQGQGAYGDRGRFPLPQVILLDLRMPRMNGLEVLAWLRAQADFRGTVVIIFTASAHPDDITRACDLGANAFVQKPSSQKELIQFLRLLKDFWAGFHQFPPSETHAPHGELAKPKLTP